MRIGYIYFDYKAQQGQSGNYIAGTLLKQLVSQSTYIPADLESLYDESVSTASPINMTALIQFLTSLSKEFRIYTVFDAMDECSEDHQQDILSLLSSLAQSGYRILLSSRPHLHILRDQLGTLSTLTISADETDLECYAKARLIAERNRNEELESRCIVLVKESQGM